MYCIDVSLLLTSLSVLRLQAKADFHPKSAATELVDFTIDLMLQEVIIKF